LWPAGGAASGPAARLGDGEAVPPGTLRHLRTPVSRRDEPAHSPATHRSPRRAVRLDELLHRLLLRGREPLPPEPARRAPARRRGGGEDLGCEDLGRSGEGHGTAERTAGPQPG